MKTIDINLIGEFAKSIKSNKLELKKDNLDSRTRIIVIAFLTGTFVILLASLGVWLLSTNMSNKTEARLNKLKEELTGLKQEQALLSAYTADLKNRMKIARLKLLARKQVNGLFIPWSEILRDLAAKVPKNVVINDIKKITAGQMSISGVVSANVKPLTAVSFLILNINEDEESLLTGSKIKSLKYDKEADLYEFEIEAALQKAKQE